VEISIRKYRERDAEEFHQAVLESADHLSEWLPWCTPHYSIADASEWSKSAAQLAKPFLLHFKNWVFSVLRFMSKSKTTQAMQLHRNSEGSTKGFSGTSLYLAANLSRQNVIQSPLVTTTPSASSLCRYGTELTLIACVTFERSRSVFPVVTGLVPAR
jgi:hypothetical protein